MKTTRVNAKKTRTSAPGASTASTEQHEHSMRMPQDGPPVFPQLPDPITVLPKLPEELLRLPIERQLELEKLFPLKFYSLDAGCYLVRFNPTGLNYHYDGTIRVQRQGNNTIASGDLYQHNPIQIWPLPTIPVIKGGILTPQTDASFFLGEPNPANGVPVFARSRYRYYLRITQILEFVSLSNTFTLGFEMWKFNGVSASPMWTKEAAGPYQAQMTFGTAPAGYPAGADYLTGTVRNAANVAVGTMTMGRVSGYLRKATVEIDRVANSEAPLDSGAGHTWQSIFDQVKWQLNVVTSNADVAEPSGNSWSDGEMHAAMLARRDSANLDTEWRYHVLAVKNIDSTPRGIMYDNGGTDSNNVPREGIGISSHWVIPNTSTWGKVKGQRFGAAKAPYFRTALHEIGHAMGLYHNTVDMGIMNTTDVISAGAVAPVQFPDNIKWAHAADDQKRLMHMPDVFVRPGGVSFGTAYSTHPLSPDDEHEEAVGLELHVQPVQDVLPIGAPVRLEISLANTAPYPLPAPESLSMKYGCVSGRVIDPSGTVRTFKTLLLCVDEVQLRYLEPGEQLTDSLTLLRGAEGALFPSAGSYTVEVEVSWDMNGGHVGVSSQTHLFVTTAQTKSHARAALQVLSTPDTLLSLVLTGDHHVEGNAAIQAALDDKVLRPHYAYLEAKRLAQPFQDRKANLDKAADLLDAETVMSTGEIRKCTKLVKQADAGNGNGNSHDGDAKSRIAAVLRTKTETHADTDSMTATLVALS